MQHSKLTTYQYSWHSYLTLFTPRKCSKHSHSSPKSPSINSFRIYKESPKMFVITVKNFVGSHSKLDPLFVSEWVKRGGAESTSILPFRGRNLFEKSELCQQVNAKEFGKFMVPLYLNSAFGRKCFMSLLLSCDFTQFYS